MRPALAAPRVLSPPLWRGAAVLGLYHVVFTLLGLVTWPWLLWRFATDRQHRAAWLARTGRVEPTAPGARAIWIHGVSVGEVKAASTLIERLRVERPELQLVVSATTPTGHAIARKLYPDARVIYYPLDFGVFPGRALDRIRPECVLLMELEIWPNFLQAATRRSVPVVIVNGRISKRSFRGYRFVRALLPQLGWVERFLVQDEAYRERLLALGLDPTRIAVTGNMKYDSVMLRDPPADSERVRRWLAPDDRLVLVCGSTHGQEDEWLARVVARVQERLGRPVRLVLAPRHPERSAAVVEALHELGAPCVRWTRCRAGEAELDEDAIVVVDTIGQLESFYGACDVAFVGGSLVRHGGQNMLEPAVMARAVVVGPHTENFKRDVEMLVGADAIVVVSDRESLADAFERLLRDPDERAELGRRAVEVIRSNQGATQRTLDLLQPVLSRPSESGHRNP